jgi:hypothetical protein
MIVVNSLFLKVLLIGFRSVIFSWIVILVREKHAQASNVWSSFPLPFPHSPLSYMLLSLLLRSQ